MVSSCHSNACFNAWIQCEDMLSTLHHSLSRRVSKVIDECALICMGTFHVIKNSSRNMQRMAVLCVGICEECADLCESLDDAALRGCARTCRFCSEKLTEIAFSDWQ